VTILTQRANQACDAARGWLDPEDGDGMRRPRFVDDPRGHHRLCELRQLTGDDLAACRTDALCTDCRSGFCQSELPGLDHCAAGEFPSRLRFVRDAVAGSGATVRIDCGLVP
jgi:hypothetical protein